MEESKFYVTITYKDPQTFGAMDYFVNVTKVIFNTDIEFLCIVWEKPNITDDTYVITKTVIPADIIAKIEITGDGDIQISNYF